MTSGTLALIAAGLAWLLIDEKETAPLKGTPCVGIAYRDHSAGGRIGAQMGVESSIDRPRLSIKLMCNGRR